MPGDGVTGPAADWRPPTAPVQGARTPTPRELMALRDVAAGRRAATLALRGGRVVHVHTGEIIESDVIVHGRHIAAVVPPGRLDATETVELDGRYVAPTLIDAHLHIEYTMLTPGQLARLSVPRGTTTVFNDPDCVANVLGAPGVDHVRGTTTPLRLFHQVTSDVPRRGVPSIPGATIPQEQILARLAADDAVSLGESNPFLHDTELAEAMSVALGLGRRITGHTARLSGEPLWAYLAGGVGDDHNAATLDEVLERLRLGAIVTLQAGSMSDYLADILANPADLGLVTSHLAFCADDKHVTDLVATGHIDHHVRRAVELGVAAPLALRMGSLNAASHFRLDHLIGSVTPSRLADLQVLDDLERFEPAAVYVDGTLVARDGEALFDDTDTTPVRFGSTMRLGGGVGPATITVAAPADHPGDRVWVQAMEMYDGYYKRAFHCELPVTDGQVRPDPEIDVAKIAVLDRHQASASAGVGFVRGFGLRAGALACTTNCDNGNLVAIGTDDHDIVAAARALDAAGGGFVAVRDGEVVELLALPVAGLMSADPWEVTAEGARRVDAAARSLGCVIPAPFMILSFVGLVGVPDLGLTELGLVDVASQRFAELVLDDGTLDDTNRPSGGHGPDGRPTCRCAASTARRRDELLATRAPSDAS
ncbi:MAG: adenine deaminase C-terminal domain-containing protein [Actinomycetota bacterium]|nr:adenine deaminase C-terminal domain-containing protein [Actinomycetota bacterium]